MAVKATATCFGAIFGFAISWGQFTDPDRIRDMLLLDDPYIYLMMASAIAVGFGAKLAGGCTSGNGIGGCSAGSPASFTATATFMGTAIAASFAIEALI